jgi:hypothetical protein
MIFGIPQNSARGTQKAEQKTGSFVSKNVNAVGAEAAQQQHI